jgi:hypothetical protein
VLNSSKLFGQSGKCNGFGIARLQSIGLLTHKMPEQTSILICDNCRCPGIARNFRRKYSKQSKAPVNAYIVKYSSRVAQ